jgi:hypothetical protein
MIRRSPTFSRLQTKKLRKIDCGNRFCVWSIAHPQPVNLCQPCYCDKVREPHSPSHLHPLNLIRPHLPNPASTPFLLDPSPATLPSFFPFASHLTPRLIISLASSSLARMRKRRSLPARLSTALIATTGTADRVSNSSGGASIAPRYAPFLS